MLGEESSVGNDFSEPPENGSEKNENGEISIDKFTIEAIYDLEPIRFPFWNALSSEGVATFHPLAAKRLDLCTLPYLIKVGIHVLPRWCDICNMPIL